MPPYSQVRASNGTMVRYFSSSLTSDELEWHMDRQDRHVRVLEGSDWKLQLENGLPLSMNVGETYFIPKNSWHRVIKGSGNLMIEIKESTKVGQASMSSKKSVMKNRKIQIVRESSDERFRIFLAEVGLRVATMEAQGYTEDERRQFVTDVFSEALRRSHGRPLTEDAAPAGAPASTSFMEKLSNKGFFQGIQGQIADWFLGPVADKLGVPRDGYVYKVMHNVFENMDAATVKSLMAGNGCKPLASKFAGALQESVVETILQQFGLAQSGFSKIIAESLQAAFVEGGPFVETLSKYLCEIDFMSLLPGGGLIKSVKGMFSSDEKPAAASQAAATTAAAT